MEEALYQYFLEHGFQAFGTMVVTMVTLVWGADRLVKEAVALSLQSGLPKVVIGATVVSLGTTSPEAAVSVLAAIKGSSDLALGNAVGSIICDTGLILGVACMLRSLPLDRRVVNRQGWLQVAAGFLLVLGCWPPEAPLGAFRKGGNLPLLVGIIFVFLLVGYLWLSVRWARREKKESEFHLPDEEFEEAEARQATWLLVLKLLGALLLVVASSWFLIPAVRAGAVIIGIHPAIAAATIVAFGTSLPELVTAVTATLRGHGELAVGNVIGADILNVLFVAGVAAAVTPAGLEARPIFFALHFPAMLVILIIFRIGIAVSGKELRRPFGVTLFVIYLAYAVLNFVFGRV